MIISKKRLLFFIFFLNILAISSKKNYAVEIAINENGYPEISVSGSNNYNYAERTLSKVNSERQSIGASKLTIDKKLTEASYAESCRNKLIF